MPKFIVRQVMLKARDKKIDLQLKMLRGVGRSVPNKTNNITIMYGKVHDVVINGQIIQ